MRRTRFVFSFSFAFLLPALAVAQQQPGAPMPAPRLLSVMPAGARAGSTVEITLIGQDIEEAEALFCSQPGVQAELIDKGTAAGTDPKKPVPITVRFKVTVPPDTPLGIHDLRLVNKWGISNPRAFVVGDLNEVLEKESNNDVAEAQRVELNTTVNGVIASPTDVDYFAFTGKKGQRVVVSCLTSSIDSRLPAALQLYNGSGQLLASNRNYHHNDALLDCTLPADGDYQVRLYSFAYIQGGPDYFYRLTISTAPWIDAVFPPVVEAGKPAQLTVYGRNLPGGKPDPSAVVEGRVLEKVTVTVQVPKEPAELQRLAFNGHVPPIAAGLDGFEYRIKNNAGSSNGYLLTYAQAPVVLDNGKNDTPESAQPLELPCEVAGWIEQKRDRDWYCFTAKKGDVYIIEAYGDRLGSPVDLYYLLRSAEKGQSLGEFDDNPEILSTTHFYTRSDDPARQRWVAPADGTYQLMISSRESYAQAGPRHLYRLRITPEHPDFRLVVLPHVTNAPEGTVVHQGGKQYYSVYVWRLDGFNDDITLSADGLPPGVRCPPQKIGTGMRQGTLVLSADADAMPWTGAIRVKGTATIHGQQVEREARAASVTWPVQQQNAVTMSRLDRDLVLAVRERAPFDLTASLDKPAVLHGDKLAVTVKLTRLWPELKGAVQLTALNLPPTMQLPPTNITDKDVTLTLIVNPTVPPGTYTIVVRGQVQQPFAKDPKQKPTNRTLVAASTPLTVTVLPKQVATVSVTPANPTLKAGGQVELLVKVTRQGNFTGEFQVQLAMTPEMKGLSAEPVTIPAGKDEAKLVLKAAADAAAGPRKGLIQATAQVAPKTVTTQEAKFTVTVAK